MTEKTIFIGVDPGSTTGIAIWRKKDKELKVYQFVSHFAAIEFLQTLFLSTPKQNIKFRIEDARLARKNAYFKDKNDHSKDQGVGGVKALSKDWESFCKILEIDYEMVPPNHKLTKVTPEYFEKLTGIKTLKTHSHSRDSGLLVYGL